MRAIAEEMQVARARLTPNAEFPEPEQLLRDLKRNAAYWERQAMREKRQIKVRDCLERRDRCLRLAAEIYDDRRQITGHLSRILEAMEE